MLYSDQQFGEMAQQIAQNTLSASAAMVNADPEGGVSTTMSADPTLDPFAPFYEAARTFGAPLLAAPERRMVRRTIERMLRKHSIAEMVRAGDEHADEVALRYAELQAPTERDRRVFGPSAETIHEGLRLGAEVAAARQRIALATGAAVATEGVESPDPMEMALSSETPPPVRELLFASLCALPAILALAEARHRDEPIAPWLAEELAACWVEGQRATLKVLATVPQAAIPEALVPMDERLDLAEIERDMERFHAQCDAGIDREVSRRLAARDRPAS